MAPDLVPADRLLDRLRALPSGAAVLRALGDEPGVHLVGGAVRDLLLGGSPHELDLVVEGDAAALARRLDPGATVHERFGTASAAVEGHAIDLAVARRERYPRPGALPEVEPAGLEEDLRRRDVTINAIALRLADGALAEVPGAREDLAAGVLRVLHDASFREDPTRLHRVARYAARLGFEPDRHTVALATDAVNAGALGTVSGQRIGAELRLALAEPDPLLALGWMTALGAMPPAHHRRAEIEQALALLPAGGRPGLLILGAWLAETAGLGAWLDHLGFPAGDRDVAVAVGGAEELVADVEAATRPSQLHALLSARPVEEVALAGALGAERAVRTFFEELRHVRLTITGEDLVAAGVPRGPEVGRRLRAALAARLDGDIGAGRDAEVAAALRG